MPTVDQNCDDASAMDKENAEMKDRMGEGDIPVPTTQSSGTKCQEAQPEKKLPQTPAHRIPLADLISNTEDAFSRAPGRVISPEDHVFWKHEPCNTDPRDASGSPITRCQKRYRSASPTSSPLGADSKHNVSSPQSLPKLLRTPQHDIAADLWSKYIGKGTGNPGGDAPKPQFAHLVSSSPQTPTAARAGRDSSTLRRSNSCNVYWPTSNTKRRRVDNEQQAVKRVRDIFAGSRSSLLGDGTSKSSKISLLVGKIQETLLKSPREEISGPSSSTPLPERPDNMAEFSGSPPKPRNEDENNPIDTPSRCSRRVMANDAVDNDAMDTIQDLNATLSEFDDDELDDDFLEFAGKADNQHKPIYSEVGPLPDAVQEKKLTGVLYTTHAKPDGSSTSSIKKNYKQPTVPTSHAHTNSDEVDEFNDSDDEFPEAMEEVLARYDLKEQTNAGKKTNYILEEPPAPAFETAAVLFVQEEKTNNNRAITLRESWYDTPCSKGSYVHLIGSFDHMGRCVVDNSDNMIILHPDHLISATVVADSFTCPRRAVLQDRVKATSQANKPQVYGHILHEIFQSAASANRWDQSWLREIISRTLEHYVESLYEIQVEISEATEYLMSKMPALSSWADIFMRSRPTIESITEDRNGSSSCLSINKLLEVEEHIWSPMYGLKGNVDATVQVVVQEGTEEKTLTVPFELKTGRNNSNEAHRAQTALYTLLLSDRYDIDVTFGILYYLEATKTFRVRAIRSEIRQMIQQRNRLAEFICTKSKLPPMLKKSRICNQCYAKDACFIYHKIMDDGDEESSGMGPSFLEAVGHLTPSHQNFFKKWDALLTMEERDVIKFRRELWTMLSSEREGVGRCFGNVMVEPGSAYEETSVPKINRFRYTFYKHQPPSNFSFGESQLSVGEPIVVSDEKGHFALANGYVTHISRKRISVAVDRRLHNARTRCSNFDADRHQAFTGIMEIVETGGSESTVFPEKAEDTTLYRLDKDEFSNGMATVRNNLVCMMDRNMFRTRRLRELIIDGHAPSFKPTSSSTIPCLVETELNIDQKQAIEKVMSANDYALVLGMPGTGKTTTIAHIIRALVSQGKSVLLTSYTHTAVDNILLKVKDDNIRTLRLGATTKIHPDVQKFADLAATPKKTIEELRDIYENSRIVATTCLGINHPIFNSRTFDYCIVDEASQITLPVCMGPIRMAKTFILVGDHYQLPPLVQDKEAREGGLDVSLFKLLCDLQPASVVNLEHQYRMCEDIMLLSNTLIYSGHLKCGTPEVAQSYLKIPNLGRLKQHHVDSLSLPPNVRNSCLGSRYGRCWIRDLLDPVARTRLVNTDPLEPQATESSKGSRIINPIEATLCAQLVESFISVGIPARDIGVVTLYRSQLSLLKQNLRHHPDLEMHTADRFQGRDKEIIIMSCVRSNSEQNVGELLRDWRRVNVAFTRARTKLLIVGSKTTLRDGNELLGKFVQLMDSKAWTYDLPRTAVEQHVFENAENGLTQLSPRKGMEVKRSNSMSPKKRSPVKKIPKKRVAFHDQSPLKDKQRVALSPVKNRQPSAGLRRPEKIGGKLLDGARIVATRPVLMDVLNDLM
ncbi:DNA replication ATP-dependent helicase Dna2 [Blastomyces silverae]|uniref:DNA replication ATP-dependent helicase/nuclease n=1 Tax=Blastomyces silverae TaxID=2060906 RepID=A0A0H1BG99_9EURO|nr:DNA replication ATP-dependent helicase Dna2 [Blastomyces silverae]